MFGIGGKRQVGKLLLTDLLKAIARRVEVEMKRDPSQGLESFGSYEVTRPRRCIGTQ